MTNASRLLRGISAGEMPVTTNDSPSNTAYATAIAISCQATFTTGVTVYLLALPRQIQLV